MKLVVGLGNPGKTYENTRHNIGFMVLNYFPGNNFQQERFNSLYYKTKVNGKDVVFVEPLTYMNLSGEAVAKFVNFYKIDSKDILIIQDDLDLTVANYKLKFKSSSGGHNGLKSIIKCLGTDEIPRLKIGISNNKLIDTKDYVLHKFSGEELEELNSIMPMMEEIIKYFIDYGIEETMSKYNRK